MMTTRRTFIHAIAAMPALYPGLLSARPERGDRRLSGEIPNVPLQTHEGKSVRFYEDLVRDKLVVINMMYATCSNICPISTANLLLVQQALGSRVGQDIFMYSITLQPELDTPRVLRDYVRKYNIDPGWLFLTGKPHDIELVRRSLGFFDPDPVTDANISQHTGMLRIGHDARRRWSMVPAMARTRQILSSISAYL